MLRCTKRLSLPLLPTPGAPITATFTSPRDDFFLLIPRIPVDAILFDIVEALLDQSASEEIWHGLALQEY